MNVLKIKILPISIQISNDHTNIYEIGLYSLITMEFSNKKNKKVF